MRLVQIMSLIAERWLSNSKDTHLVLTITNVELFFIIQMYCLYLHNIDAVSVVRNYIVVNGILFWYLLMKPNMNVGIVASGNMWSLSTPMGIVYVKQNMVHFLMFLA